jgi:hypothetical protein
LRGVSFFNPTLTSLCSKRQPRPRLTLQECSISTLRHGEQIALGRVGHGVLPSSNFQIASESNGSKRNHSMRRIQVNWRSVALAHLPLQS